MIIAGCEFLAVFLVLHDVNLVERACLRKA